MKKLIFSINLIQMNFIVYENLKGIFIQFWKTNKGTKTIFQKKKQFNFYQICNHDKSKIFQVLYVTLIFIYFFFLFSWKIQIVLRNLKFVCE